MRSIFIMGIVAVILSIGCYEKPIVPADVNEINIFLHGFRAPHMAFVCKDKGLINEMILEPLQDKKVDPSPARYEVFGSVSWDSDTDDKPWIMLYLPWGRFSYHSKYYIADFDELKKYVFQQKGIGRPIGE